MTAGKLVLSPTRTYAPILKKILDNFRPHIHGLVHNSGGGQTKVLHFVDNLHIIKDNLFPAPPLFQLIQHESKTDWKEMYQVFNMGHRMEVYCAASLADQIIDKTDNSFRSRRVCLRVAFPTTFNSLVLNSRLINSI